MLEEATTSNATYLKIIGGRVAQKVEADTPGAVAREYENDSGETVTTYDKFFKSVTGYITGLSIEDGSYGAQIKIRLLDEGEVYILNIGSSTSYFGSFCEKVPNIDPTQKVRISAYDFVPEGAKIGKDGKPKSKKGITLIQDEEKLLGAYWDGKQNIGGFPTVSKEDMAKYDSDDWKVHFINITKFHKKAIEEISPKFTIDNVPEEERGKGYDSEKASDDTSLPPMPDVDDEISVEDIPF